MRSLELRTLWLGSRSASHLWFWEVRIYCGAAGCLESRLTRRLGTAWLPVSVSLFHWVRADQPVSAGPRGKGAGAISYGLHGKLLTEGTGQGCEPSVPVRPNPRAVSNYLLPCNKAPQVFSDLEQYCFISNHFFGLAGQLSRWSHLGPRVRLVGGPSRAEGPTRPQPQVCSLGRTPGRPRAAPHRTAV